MAADLDSAKGAAARVPGESTGGAKGKGPGGSGASRPTLADDDHFVSLYRRFRPGRFAELRGQPHVVRALQGAARDGRVAHAYLFSGPRGTGKTSTARILARALNCAAPVDGEPCGACPSCVDIARGSSLDVHELDAASNNGVDAMRDLIAHAALATPGRWKVYIVDEVHMLSNAAANALLKTLEEPPGHVVFVLATTDPQKVPPTIKSRTQHFEFGLLGPDTLAELLRDVNEAAGLSLDDADLSVAVRKGRGSARDALSAMDQVAASGSADALRPDVAELTEAITGEDARRALVAVATLHDAGWGPQQLATELVDELRQAFLAALAPELCTVVGQDRERLAERSSRMGLPRLVRSIEHLGRAQVDMREAPDPRALLEVTLVRLARPELDETTDALLDRLARLEQAISGSGPAPFRRAGLPPQGAASTAGPEAGSTGETETSPGERPGFGALRRQRSGAPPSAPRERPGSGVLEDDGEDPGGRGPSEEPSSPPDGHAPAQTSERPTPDRDALVQAWGDHILRALPARAKVLYSPGRFVATDGTTAVFALPNPVHRDKCQDVRSVVEQAISAHFGAPVSLDLTVDGGQVAPGRTSAPSDREGGGDPEPVRPAEPDDGLDPDDDIDPDQPSGPAETVAQARLLQAFPGAEEVTG